VPPRYRGSLVFLFQFFITLGLLFAYLIDLWFQLWQFAVMAILALVFIWVLVPETKNKPLEAIGDYWRNGRSWEAAERDKDRQRGGRGAEGEGQPATA
jgi:hypothetical protein